MKRVIIVLGSILGLVAIIYLIGASLPVEHSAAVRIELDQPPEMVWATLTDVEMGTAWRTGLESVRVTSRKGEAPIWTETNSFGSMTLRTETFEPPRLWVARIEGSGDFGGTWTYRIEPRDRGSLLTITEDGEVYSPLFRFMSKYIFGHYGTLETFATDLGKHVGSKGVPERVGDG